MPKDNEVDEKVRPVAWAMTDYQSDGPNTQFTRDPYAAEYHAGNGIGVEPLYSAATVAELRAEVERLQFQLGLEQVRVYERDQKIAMLADKADAAERRVGELEAAASALVTAMNNGDDCRGEFARLRLTLTGADPT